MIKPKKSLGQNFLIDSNIIDKIVKIANVKNKNVLEIGPGTGNLTMKIIKEKPKNFLIIEKDKQLSNQLEKLTTDKIEVLNQDILKFDLESNLKKNSIIIGNLPYNISSQILINLIKFKNWPPKYDKLVLMFQKEVAYKIIAQHKSPHFGRISVMANWRLEIVDYFNISNNCFFPKPKVESTILVLKPKINKQFAIKNINNLEKITRIIFSNRRKMVNKALRKIFKEPETAARINGIDLSLRPSDISENLYYKLTEYYEKNN